MPLPILSESLRLFLRDARQRGVDPSRVDAWAKGMGRLMAESFARELGDDGAGAALAMAEGLVGGRLGAPVAAPTVPEIALPFASTGAAEPFDLDGFAGDDDGDDSDGVTGGM